MDFLILGPLEVRDGDRPVAVGGARQRALLGMLLLHPNEVVSTDRLIEEIWAGERAEGAAKALQVAISRLRKVLAPGVLVTRSPGYELRVEPERVDSRRFELMVAGGRAAVTAGNPAKGAALIAEALRLWRGAPFADLAYESFCQAEIGRLEELRLSAIGERVAADLERGLGAELIGELQALVAEHPLRERFRAQLIRALYRAGRQADALEAYTDARRMLVEELGIEPTPELQELQRAVLDHDPSLEARPPAAGAPAQSIAFAASRDERPEVIGRRDELELVRDFAAGTGPAMLLLEGEAGIGKTTLLCEAVAGASEAGARVLAAWPAAAESELAFSGLGDLLGDVLDEVLPELPAPQVRALEIALLRREPSGRPVDPHTVSAAVLTALRALAARQPLVVAVDDVQWLDRETAGALAFAFRRLNGSRARLVAAHRVEHLLTQPALIESLPRDRVARLPVGSLSATALHAVIQLHAGRTLPRPALLRINEVTAGNPFYALQLVRSLPDQEPLAMLRVPPSLEALTRERLGRLQRPVLRLLEPAALLREPTVYMLEALAAEPDRAGDRLDRAVAAGIVKVSAGRVRFTHPLLADTMASLIGPRRRSQLHADLARLVDDPEQRARHLALADPKPTTGTAAEIETGARGAAARGASAAAAELLEIAASLTPRVAADDRRRRTIEAARAYKSAGLPSQGKELLESTLADLPSGAQRADALVALAELSNDDFDAADRALEEALADAHADDERLSVIYRQRAYAHSSHAGRYAAVEYAEMAVAAAIRAGEPRVLVPALTYLAALETWGGCGERGTLERALELRRGDDSSLSYMYSPSVVRGLQLMCLDRLDEARALWEARATEAERRGDDYTYSSLLVYLVELECRAARFHEAAAHAVECRVRSEQRGERYQGGAVLWATAFVDAHLGRVEEARAAAERGTKLSTDMGEEVYRVLNRFALGFLELSLGDVVRADAILRTLPPRLVDLGWDEPSLFPVWPNAIEALIGVGEHDLAARYLDLFSERALRCDCPWALATAARCRGQLLLAEGDTDGALAACDQALQEHRRTPGAFEHCRTLLTLGSAQRRARRLRDARETLGQALAGFGELGAPLWAERTRAELGRIGGRTGSPDELTPSERRVAALVAEGRTNKEVASALVVSVHTVEAALTQVYRKLEVRSRTELARRYPTAGTSKD